MSPQTKKTQKKHGPPLRTAEDLQSRKGRDERRANFFYKKEKQNRKGRDERRASVTDPVLRG
jgi:hypothetical protein